MQQAPQENASGPADPYVVSGDAVREPPTSLREALPYLGPGFILSASIVGSGELIATTIFGAEAGFVLMWFIIFSCLIKVAVQLEFGKHAICSGESTMAAFNALPGPRLLGTNWSIWTWLLLMIVKMMQVGGIVGGVVLAIEQFLPPPTLYDLSGIDRAQPVSVYVDDATDAISIPANWTAEQWVAQLNARGATWQGDEPSDSSRWSLVGAERLRADGSATPKLSLATPEGAPKPLTPELPGQRIVMSFLVAVSVALLVFGGYYQLLEKASLVMIAAFTLFTLASLLALQRTDFAISGAEFLSGCIPSIPDYALFLVAMGAFGITGVGGDEIMAYNYWLIEKGYAAYTGPREDSPAWERRAKGWIRIMHYDAMLSALAYTAMTAMFYLLGAAVLHRRQLVPEGSNLIQTLGEMYTVSLGPSARIVFVAGAIVVLYSTLFAALAAWTRLFSDAFGRLGLFDFENQSSRRKAIGLLAWLIPLGWAALFLYMGKPAVMVLLGGVATVAILLIVVFATMWFRYRRMDPRLQPSRWYDACLTISVCAIVCVAALSAKGVITQAWEAFFAP